MSSPFKEAHQFKGVFPDPTLVEAANRPGVDAVTAAKLREKPALTRAVSLHFTSTDTYFDVQEDESGQYLVLEPTTGGRRPRAYTGDWIVLMPSGKFQVFSNEDYLAMGGTE